MTARSAEAVRAEARRMIAAARAQFRAQAAPFVRDAATQRFVDTLEQAVGEVSPDQAMDGLLRWLDERDEGGAA